ncbi:MAG: hypothetical protein U5L75_00570 [Candidatus Campbellbacteria bacterium]|nr:hypothetical protein [Candidatus Campbellbacteria bacterium]
MYVEPDELEELLVKTARLTEENHRMLEKMQRAQRMATLMRVVRWLVVIGLFVLLYYLAQPYIAEMQAFFESFQETLENSDEMNADASGAFEGFLDNFDNSEEAEASSGGGSEENTTEENL